MGDSCISSSGFTNGVATPFVQPPKAEAQQAFNDVFNNAAKAQSALKSGDTKTATQAMTALSNAFTKLGMCTQSATIDAAKKAVQSGQAISPAAQQLLSQFGGLAKTASAAPAQSTWGHSGVSSFVG